MVETTIKGIGFDFPCKETNHHRHKKVPVSLELKECLIKNRFFTGLGKYQRIVAMKDWLLIGENVYVEKYSSILEGSHIYTIGAFSYCRSNLPVNTIIGRYTSISVDCRRLGLNHPMDRFTSSHITYQQSNMAINSYKEDNQYDLAVKPNQQKNGVPLIFGNDVWVGENVSFVSSGITVGDGAVIAANATVTKDVEPYSIVGGTPAKHLKYRFDENTRKKLLDLRWWQYDLGTFFEKYGMDLEINDFIEKLQNELEKGTIKPFNPGGMRLDDFLISPF